MGVFISLCCIFSASRRCAYLKPPGIRFGAQRCIYYLLSFLGERVYQPHREAWTRPVGLAS